MDVVSTRRSVNQRPRRAACGLGVAATDVAEVEKAAQGWIDWYEASSASLARPMLVVRRAHGIHLLDRRAPWRRRAYPPAPEYYEGRLDWYDFRLECRGLAERHHRRSADGGVRTAIPAPPTFRGMPALRFSEFEDAQVDFGSVDAGPTDLARILMVEFALAYGNDWFVMPIDLDVGALYRTRSLVVTDTFGVRSLIPCSADMGAPFSTWRMFQHSPTHASGSRGRSRTCSSSRRRYCGTSRARPSRK